MFFHRRLLGVPPALDCSSASHATGDCPRATFDPGHRDRFFGGSAPVLAQSYEAPGGNTPATQPGGTEGLDGRRNEREAIQGGEAVRVPRGEGVEVDRSDLPRRRERRRDPE
jgi:hypothetical protein